MNKIAIKVALSISIFGAGVVFGKQIQKNSQAKKTSYGGTLQINNNGEIPELYLALEMPVEKLATLTDVIIKVGVMK